MPRVNHQVHRIFSMIHSNFSIMSFLVYKDCSFDFFKFHGNKSNLLNHVFSKNFLFIKIGVFYFFSSNSRGTKVIRSIMSYQGDCCFDFFFKFQRNESNLFNYVKSNIFNYVLPRTAASSHKTASTSWTCKI